MNLSYNRERENLLKCFAFFRLKGNQKRARQNNERNKIDKGQRANDEEQKQIEKRNKKFTNVFAEYGQAVRQTADRRARSDG